VPSDQLTHLKAESPERALTTVEAPISPKEDPMLDVIVLTIGLGFFALSVGYTIACDRL
jgi:hypothetical protein